MRVTAQIPVCCPRLLCDSHPPYVQLSSISGSFFLFHISASSISSKGESRTPAGHLWPCALGWCGPLVTLGIIPVVFLPHWSRGDSEKGSLVSGHDRIPVAISQSK